MTYFLDRIAQHISEKYGDRLESQCLVFPGRRAGLYFLKYLAARTGKPVWSPAVKTINDLFGFFSTLQIADPELLIFELYKVYTKLNKDSESFDDFYFWGEMLINDFDDADKYLADASGLFTNVSDIKKIDSEFGALTPEQIKVIKNFWVNFDPDSPTDQKKGFLRLWSVLPRLYREYRETLITKGLAYEGIVYREIAERCMKDDLPEFKWERFHFIGFNALNECEKILMKYLRRHNKASFYWDYDNSFVSEKSKHSAGYFIRNNIRDFGSDMPSDWNYDTFVSGSPGIVKRHVIETSSDIAQVKLIPGILGKIPEVSGSEAHHTAIVLADENLLVPLLSTIPEFVTDVNITMGYPVRLSPVYTLIKSLINLQKNSKVNGSDILFDHNDVFNILKQSYICEDTKAGTDELISAMTGENRQWITAGSMKSIESLGHIFIKTDSPAAFTSYLRNILEAIYITGENDAGLGNTKFENRIRNELIYCTLLAINRLSSITGQSGILMTTVTYFRLVDKVVRALSVPFSGEPLNGVQIMGILETRTLDFKNLILLSVNEGILPGGSSSSSYIPYNIREAFGLPTIRHQDSIYAYYFYRLLERSENVTFIYNSDSEGLRSGEMSRYLLQLRYLDQSPPEFFSVGYRFSLPPRTGTTVIRSDEIQTILEQKYINPGRKSLSPSAVNMWLNCRMRFYYRYVCGLKEPDRILTEIDSAKFGELLHEIMKRLYTPYQGRKINSDSIESIRIDKKSLEAGICEIINSKYGRTQSELRGNDQIIRYIIQSYVDQILRYDASLGDISIKGLEKEFYLPIRITLQNREVEINAGGVIDRIDVLGSSVRIVDYKTGFVNSEIDSLQSLFEYDSDMRNDAILQLLMYCEIYSGISKTGKTVPSLYAIRNLNETGFSDRLRIMQGSREGTFIEDYSVIRTEFLSGLESVLASVFDKDLPFTMTQNYRRCEYCPYRKLCQR
jgi:CRISPR/Cas system-associated exonuclease Cas4 (RecB family)